MYTMLSSHRKVWSQFAICPEYPKLFADDLTKSTIKAAKGICAMCPVLELCKEWAVINDVEGMFGGTTTTERKVLKKGLPQEVLELNPPEPKLLDYVKDTPVVVQKPSQIQTPVEGATHRLTEKPKSVYQRAKSAKQKLQQEPLSLLASLDQLLLELPAFS